MLIRYSLDYENCNLEYDPEGNIVDYGDHCVVVHNLQSRLEEVNRKVEELEKENASLKQDATRMLYHIDQASMWLKSNSVAVQVSYALAHVNHAMHSNKETNA